VKTAALYLVSIQSYSKNTIDSHFVVGSILQILSFLLLQGYTHQSFEIDLS
jgi:hypothetical protein